MWYRYPSAPGPTLHVSGWTDGMMEARATLIAGNIDRIARGEPPLSLITT